MSSLQSVLAARKAQYATSVHTHLVGLRSGNEADSDDDDDDATAVAPVAGQAQPNELLLGRAENLLRSAKVEERKRTIASLEGAELSSTQLKPLLRPLLLSFSDDSERCRDGAVGLFRRWQSLCSDASEVSGALPFLMPVMVERLGSETVQEPSEEVRASLVMLMRDVLLKCRQLLRPYIAEIGAIALGCARDKHPEVIKGLCELMTAVSADVLRPLCKETTPKQVKPFSQKLIQALLPHILHRHGAVRLAVLGALEELLLCGAGQSVETLTGWRLKNNVPVAEFYGKGEPRLNYLADLSRDGSVAVRRKFVRVVARWCREMDGEDLYEQEVRIIPYLVSGLTDDDEATANASIEEIDRLGDMYLEKNMADYKERIEYGHADELAATRAMSLPPPKPLRVRPPLGSRERVKSHFRALIHPICAELQMWTSVERLQSARLLEVLLAYSESSVTEFTHQLLPALAKGMDPETKGLPEVIGRCAALLAQHTEPEEYLPLLIGHANSDPLNPLSQRVANLELLPHLLRGVKPDKRSLALRGIAPLLADAQLVCTQHTLLRAPLRAALEAAIATTAALASSANAPAAGGDGSAASAARMLLRATAMHLASAPQLQPTVVTLGDGLEDIVDADEAAWASAAAVGTQMALPMAALPAGGVACSKWWREAMATIDGGADGDDEYAPLARKLIETILADAGTAAGMAAGTAAVNEGKLRALAIDECDDFSDDDEPPPPKVDAGEGDYDEYDEAELD